MTGPAHDDNAKTDSRDSPVDATWGVDDIESVTDLEDVAPDITEAIGVPTSRPVVGLDVRSEPPPKPLTRTLETLEETDEQTVLLQRNDRVPTHLFNQLDERGVRFGTIERDDEALTAIWRE